MISLAQLNLFSLRSILPGIGISVLFFTSVLVMAQNSVPVTETAIEKIDSRLNALQSSSVSSEDEKQTLSQYLEATRQALLGQIEFKKQARAYAEAQLNAVETRTAIDAELAKFSPPQLPDPGQLSSDALQSLLVERRLELRDWKNRAADIKAEIREEKNTDLSELVAEAKVNYEEKQKQSPIAEESVEAQTVAAESRAAELEMLRAKIDMLDQRLASRVPRLNILELNLTLLEQKIAAAEEQIVRLSTSKFSESIVDADEDVAESRKIAEKAGLVGGDLKTQADSNLKLALEQRQLIEKRELATERSNVMRKRIDRLSDLYTGLSEQLERPRVPRSPQYGAALLRQRALLNSEAPAVFGVDEYEQELSKILLRQFKLLEESQTQLFVDESIELKKAILESEDPQLADHIRDQRLVLINRLITEYAQYDALLLLLDDQAQQLKRLQEAYRGRIDQHMLWNPNVETFSLNTLVVAFTSIFDPHVAHYITTTVFSIARYYVHRPLLPLVSILLIVILFLFRRRHQRKLSEMRKWIGRVQHDRLGLTVYAVWLTFLLAIPVPLVIALPGLMGLIVPDLRADLALVFLYISLLYFGFEFFRQSLRENGLFEIHFHWSSEQVDLFRRKLRIFMPLFLVPAGITILLHYTGSSEVNGSLGRVAFLVSVLSFAGFSFSITRPSAMAQSQDTRLHLLLFRYLVFLLGILLPVAFAVLAIIGYQYSAENLSLKLLISIGILVGFLFTFDFATRSVEVMERQLALKRARVRRAEARKNSKKPKEDSIAAMTNEIELQMVSEHSNTLIKLIVSIAAMTSIWFIWSDLPLIIQPLDSFTLWQVSTVVEGVASVQNITVWNLLATFGVVVITYLGARNIPGTLEVLVLSHLPLATGLSYAITSIVRYVIVLSGAVFSLQLIGAEWSKLQWLIAALSVGLGFGLQEIVANFVSGVLILFERPIRLGDTVTLGEQSGTVTRIRIRATTIMDWDRKEVLIPNKAFITERLINWTLTDPIVRLIVPVGVAYGSDVDLVETVLLKAAKDCALVLDEPESSVLFNDFGDNGLGFELRVFVHGYPNIIPTQHELHKAINSRFLEKEIEISFPQRDIHFDPKPLEISIIKSDSTPVDTPDSQAVSKEVI